MMNWNFLCECGIGRSGRGDGKVDPSWQMKPAASSVKRASSQTWSLDGLAPAIVGNARSLAGQILADAKHGQSKRIKKLLDAEMLDAEQEASLLAATDLANGNTALMLAAKNGHGDTCALLLERGADPLAQNRHKQTASDLAAKAEFVDVVKLLDAKTSELKADAATGS